MNKIKRVILAILVITVFGLTGCNKIDQAVAASPTEISATEKPTEIKQLCTLQIQSLDKQNLTDNVVYTIAQLNRNGKSIEVADNLETENGLTTIELESGKYKISSSGNFETEINIDNTDSNKTIIAENNKFYNILSQAKGVCIIGDSITIGSVTDGHGWYEGLIEKFPNIESVDIAAKGGQTSASLFDNKADMSTIMDTSADTYIIALGINDVIYRNSDSRNTSYTSAEYIRNFEKLIRLINNKDDITENKFIFVAPFEHINKVSYAMPKYIRRENTHEEYTAELYNWCKQNDYAFVAPMNYIKNQLEVLKNPTDYTTDDIHPSYPLGTRLFSEGVYESSVVADIGTLTINQLYYKEKERSKTDKSYKSYPTDYILTEAPKDALNNTYFTIKNYKTGKYLELDDKNNEYTYASESDYPCYYHPIADDGSLKINNIPEGGYIINVEYNKLNYNSYLDTRIVFVNGGNIETHSYVYMKCE